MSAWSETSSERTRPRVLPLAASPAALGPAANCERSGVRRGCRTRHARRVRSRAIRNLRAALRNGIVFCAVIAAVWLALPKPPLLDGISFSQCVRDHNGKLLRVTLSADQKFRIWTPLEEISPDLIDATLRYEDKYYARHPGESDRTCPRRGGTPASSSSDYRRVDNHDATGPPSLSPSHPNDLRKARANHAGTRVGTALLKESASSKHI